eukprot:scaffold2453_cov72-Phaeocystis_antarctica.AAC.4
MSRTEFRAQAAVCLELLSIRTRLTRLDHFSMSRTELRAQAAVYHEESLLLDGCVEGVGGVEAEDVHGGAEGEGHGGEGGVAADAFGDDAVAAEVEVVDAPGLAVGVGHGVGDRSPNPVAAVQMESVAAGEVLDEGGGLRDGRADEAGHLGEVLGHGVDRVDVGVLFDVMERGLRHT